MPLTWAIILLNHVTKHPNHVTKTPLSPSAYTSSRLSVLIMRTGGKHTLQRPKTSQGRSWTEGLRGLGSGWPRHKPRWRCLRGGVVIKTMMMMSSDVTFFRELNVVVYRKQLIVPSRVDRGPPGGGWRKILTNQRRF